MNGDGSVKKPALLMMMMNKMNERKMAFMISYFRRAYSSGISGKLTSWTGPRERVTLFSVGAAGGSRGENGSSESFELGELGVTKLSSAEESSSPLLLFPSALLLLLLLLLLAAGLGVLHMFQSGRVC